jgi:hypothetical protein
LRAVHNFFYAEFCIKGITGSLPVPRRVLGPVPT